MSIYTILPKMRDSLNPWKREKGLGFFFCSTNSVVSLTKKIGKFLGKKIF